MYCPKCGTYVEDGTTTCPNCGAQIHKAKPAAESEPAGEPEEEQEGTDAQEMPEEPDRPDAEENPKTQEKKQNTRIRRPLVIVLVIVVAIVSIYALYTMWEGEEAEEESTAAEEAEAEAETETAGEGEEAQEETAGEEAEEDAAGENIVIEQENPADTYELEAFEESWKVIQQQGLDGGERFYRDFVESVYEYSNLSFTLEGSTLEDLKDYYFIKAIFNKPVMVPVYLSPGDTCTIETDELRGTVLELTCVGSNAEGDYLEDSNGQTYYCAESGSDRMAELYTGSGDRVEAPFYEGVLRIRKDAVTGDALTHGPYTIVTDAELSEEESWFNVVAFDENGYVKQLIFDGD